MGLDGLRGWAVIAVVAFHSGLLDAGWVGVDVFMALSGFLITGVIVRELDADGRLRLGAFWRRRARRLVPALLLTLALIAIVTAVEPNGWTIPTPREMLGALTYTSNWLRLGVERTYWQMFDAPSALDHLWSLAIEEQFYVVWPIVMVAAWKWRGKRGAITAATVGFIVTAAIQVVSARTGSSIERLYVGTDSRAPAFLAGALMCLTRARLIEWRATVRCFVALVGAGVVVFACFALDGQSRATYSGLLLAVSAAGAVVVVMVSTFDASHRTMWGIVNRPIRLVGRWSYGIYLVHWPVILLVGVDRSEPAVRFVVAMALSAAAAALSYEYFEKPILDRGIRRKVLAIVGVLVVAIGAFAVSERPVPEVTDEEIDALTTPLPSNELSDSDPTPSATSETERQRVLVIGDSVIYGMNDELVSVGASMGLDVAVRAAPGCTTSTSRDDQNNAFALDLCAAIRTGLRDDVERFQPDRIVIFYGGTWDPFVWNGERLAPCSSTGQERMREGLDALIVDIGGPTHVQIVVPPQMAGAYGPEAIGAAECYARMYLATPDVTFVRLDEFVCPIDATSCADEVEGDRLRHDGLHYSPEGIEVVVPMILGAV